MMTTKEKKKGKVNKGRVNNGFSVPQEIISEILKQLPVKTLLTFRCVSKLWRSIIDDPFFVESHNNRSFTRPGGINLLFLKLRNMQLYCADPEGGSALHLGSLPDMAEEYPFSLSLYSVKGLVCYERCILNPSTREIKQLPPIRIRTPAIDIEAGDDNSLTVISTNFLGFDPGASFTAGKHKVLNITEVSKTEDVRVADTQFKVLTLSGGGGAASAWRDIDHHTSDSSLNSQLDNFSVDGKRTCCINDIIYCFGTCCTPVGVIVAFEVGPESFKIMPLPQGAAKDSVYAIQVRERLALIDYNFTEIWSLEDYDKQLWNKQTLNVPHGLLDANKLIRPICSFGGEILFQYEKSKCFYYDLETETVRKVRKISKLLSKLLSSSSYGHHVETLSSPSVLFTNYVESLYRIKDL